MMVALPLARARLRPLRWLVRLRRLAPLLHRLLITPPPWRYTDGWVLGLRWLALAFVVALTFFNRYEGDDQLHTLAVVGGFVLYNSLLLLSRHYAAWPRRLLSVLALDAVAATLLLPFTGAYHSTFFFIYVVVLIGSSFYLTLFATETLGVLLAVLFAVVSWAAVPQVADEPFGLYILASKVAALLVVTLLCGLFFEQLRRERRETERERALSERLATLRQILNELTSLDLDHVLHTLLRSCRLLLRADLAMILLQDPAGAMERGASDGALPEAEGSGVESMATEALRRSRLAIKEGVAATSSAGRTTGGRGRVVSALCAPLTVGGRGVGALYLAYGVPTVVPTEDLDILTALGQEAALAIRNARLYEAERRSAAHWQRLGEMQRSFISAVSHELRTPITCIRTSTELLDAAAAAMTPTQRELTDTIAHHTRRLESLVDELMDAVRLEAGVLTLSRQPTPLGDFVGRLVRSLRPLAEARGQTLEVIVGGDQTVVDIDRPRLERALGNLVTNAIKFTPRGGQIAITTAPAPGGVEVTVADTGPGIPATERDHVFERFYVGHAHSGGLGLGLYIARQLVELHGGRLWADGAPGGGARFTISLPMNGVPVPSPTPSPRGRGPWERSDDGLP
ncbi:MAG: GAF domain-containing sensor histidine kinase [Chloroflexi bacterium]|nr:GAF domain-containing sensor histidine kinase [Chloroflexota bacterium]